MAEETAENLIHFAKLAEQAERYEDMANYMKKVAQHGSVLGDSERNLLSVAYKNVVGARRSAWRVLTSIEAKEDQKGDSKEYCKDRVLAYKKTIFQELYEKCLEVLELIDDKLLPGLGEARDDEDEDVSSARVFYLKMKGDYYRYLVEVHEKEEKEPFIDASHKAYQTAFDWSSNKMAATNPIRLGLALNYSVFFYEIMNQSQKACTFAQNAFDNAIQELDKLQEDSYKDSTLIMQLLRDNLTLWTSENEQKCDEGE